ncbi:MAG: hypothetical protein V2J26_00905 [Pacificimonas sp.]|jgi:hypothetical protein|nr:hypothetical protein [Pacificimonas sp.]
MARLLLRGMVTYARHADRIPPPPRFLQFAGFPRSGHSLIGSILSASERVCLSHELDVMGLVDARMPYSAIRGLILSNAAAFERSGRWWNGLSYDLGTDPLAAPQPFAVMGDKKGDWAVRRTLKDPDLLDILPKLIPARHQWLLVTRNPFDNIAVMSMRQNRLYDRLRIAASDASDFRARLRGAMAAGDVPAHADDRMIADYATLCRGVAAIRARVSPDDFLHVEYGSFTQDADRGVPALFDFVGIEPAANLLRACIAIVRPARSAPRELIGWSAEQRAAVERIIAKHDFLSCYTGGADHA